MDIGATEPTPHYQPRRWGRAFRALGRLARNTESTEHVFDIIQALSGDTLERTYQRFIRDADGQGLLADRPSLLAALSDREALRKLPEGSLGRAYLVFMEEGELTADGLVAAQNAARALYPEHTIALDTDRLYVAERLRDTHDLWHVLTGYGRDDSGEIANLWFSVGQFGHPGMAFIAFFGGLDGFRRDPRWGRYLYRAWLRGKRARQLVSAPIEAMLSWPLTDARTALGVSAPEYAHPEGIRRGNRKERELGMVPRAGSV